MTHAALTPDLLCVQGTTRGHKAAATRKQKSAVAAPLDAQLDLFDWLDEQALATTEPASERGARAVGGCSPNP